MDTQFVLRPIIGAFGLYKSYVVKDLTHFYNMNGRRQVEDFLEVNLKWVPGIQ